MVHVRRVDGRELRFGVSGKLWNDALVMYDRETRSLWSHVTGECIEGKLRGKRLESVPATLTTFAEWVRLHPRTRVLVKPAGEGRSSRYGDYARSDRQGIFGTRAKRAELPAKAVVQGVAIGGDAAAIPHDALRRKPRIPFQLAGRSLEAVREGGVVTIYERSPRGDSRPLSSTTAYWFAWINFYPRARVIR